MAAVFTLWALFAMDDVQTNQWVSTGGQVWCQQPR